jgi:DNA primase
VPTVIVELIAAYVPLEETRNGNFKGPCPFHTDHLSSLFVSPSKNIFKCFGCGIEGGPEEFITAAGLDALQQEQKQSV